MTLFIKNDDVIILKDLQSVTQKKSGILIVPSSKWFPEAGLGSPRSASDFLV